MRFVLSLACRLRPPEELGPDRIVRLASEASFEGIALDASVTMALLPVLAAGALRSGLLVGASLCPLADGPLGRGKRLPYLSAHEPEERLTAVQLATRTIEAGSTLGVRSFALELGPAPLETREPELRLAFARRQMGPGEPGGEVLRVALEERRARGPRLLDACRSALEPLLALAERAGVDLAIPVAATPWQVPSPREAQLLMEEFTGAPLGIALSPARWAVLEALQLPRAAERWTSLVRRSRLVWASDCVGLETELLPGLGELDWSKTGGWPAEVTSILTGAPDATIREVQRARRRLAEASPASAPTAAAP
jgi:hypothetical protein